MFNSFLLSLKIRLEMISNKMNVMFVKLVVMRLMVISNSSSVRVMVIKSIKVMSIITIGLLNLDIIITILIDLGIRILIIIIIRDLSSILEDKGIMVDISDFHFYMAEDHSIPYTVKYLGFNILSFKKDANG